MTPSPRQYLGLGWVLVATLVLLLAAFNTVADPYGIARGLGLPTFQTEPVVWSRVSAAERLRHDCSTALVGSSRVMYGFGPTLPDWFGEPACNGALGGTSMTEIRHVVRYIAEETDVKRLVLFLDLHMFHPGRGTGADFAQSRFDPDRSLLAYYAWAWTSFDATETSARVLGLQPPGGGTGARRPGTPHHANKRQLRAYLRRPKLYDGLRMAPGPLNALRDALAAASAADIPVLIVIPPVHAMQLEAMHRTGIWEVNKAWRRALVAIAEEYSGTVREVWDFATYHDAAIAALPLHPHDPPHPLWTDVSHQSAALGTATIQRVQKAWAGDDNDAKPGFGVRLHRQMLERHLASLDEGRAKYQRIRPLQIAWFDDFARDIARPVPRRSALRTR